MLSLKNLKLQVAVYRGFATHFKGKSHIGEVDIWNVLNHARCIMANNHMWGPFEAY